MIKNGQIVATRLIKARRVLGLLREEKRLDLVQRFVEVKAAPTVQMQVEDRVIEFFSMT